MRRGVLTTLVSTGVSAVATFGSGIVLARTLGTAGRGEVAAYVVWANLAVGIATVGLPDATIFLIASDRTRMRGVLRSTVRAVPFVATAALGAFLALSASSALGGVVGTGLAFALWVPIGVLALYLRSASLGLQDYGNFNIQRLLSEAAHVVPMMLLAALGLLTVVSAGVSYALAVSAACFFGTVTLRRSYEREPESPTLQMALVVRTALANYGATLAVLLSVSMGMLIMSYAASASETGAFAVALGYASVVGLIGASVGLVAFPSAAAGVPEGGAERGIWRLVAFTAAVVSLTSVSLWLLEPVLLPLLYGEGFKVAGEYAAALLFATSAFSVAAVTDSALRGYGRPGIVSASRAAAAMCILVVSALGGFDPSAVARGVAAGALCALLGSAGSMALGGAHPRRSGATGAG